MNRVRERRCGSRARNATIPARAVARTRSAGSSALAANHAEADTLLLIDFVLMDDMPESFRRRVHREGRLLYDEETLQDSLASLGDALDRSARLSPSPTSTRS
jgi:hypothetical protein